MLLFNATATEWDWSFSALPRESVPQRLGHYGGFSSVSSISLEVKKFLYFFL